MRIDAYNQIAQLYGVSRTTKTAKTQSASRMSDQVSISQAGRDYQIAKKAVSEAADGSGAGGQGKRGFPGDSGGDSERP